MIRCYHLCVAVLIFGARPILVMAKQQVHVLSLFPGGWRRGLDIAAEMAAKDVNDAPDILPDYDFIVHINNTNPTNPGKDNKGMADRLLYSYIYDGPAIPILVGTYFSSESEILCESSAIWNIVQISYGAVSPRLSDRNRCPTFYRTIYSSVQQNILRVKLLKRFGWDRVAIVAQNDLLFTAVSDNLRRLLEAENITVVASELFLHDASGTMRYIKEKDARIIIGLFFEPQARLALCEAYKQGIYGGRYAWIMRSIGFENLDFLFDPDPAVTCTGQQLAEAAEGAITTTWKLTTDSNAVMPTGKTAQEYYDEYATVSGSLYFSLHTLVYDAVLAAALALNGSVERLKSENKTLQDNAFGDGVVRDIIASTLDDMFFNGASGPVGFADDGDRLGVFNIQQFNKNGFTQTVGYYQSYDEKFVWDAPHNLTWANGAPPHDEIRKEEKLMTMSPSVLAVIFCLSTIGILLAFCILVFNIVKRKERVIKMSSPNINNVIIIGGVVSYLAAIMAGVDRALVGKHAMDHVCRARLWLLSLGFTLAFGSMFSKTWRVHRIFLNKKLEKRVVKDYQLLGMAMSFVAMETIYLLIWEVKYPLKAVTERFLNQATIEEDLMIIPSIESCYRVGFSSLSWLAGIYVFNGVLLLFGLFLAYETRHVHIKALNDSKNIGISVYNVTIMSIVGAVFSLLMDPLRYQLVYIVTSVCIIASTTSTLVLIFAPKVLEVLGFSSASGANLEGTESTLSSVRQQGSRVEPTTNNG